MDSTAVLSFDQPPFARRILDALPLTVWSVDLNGRITAANGSWSRFARENGAPALSIEADVCGRSIFSNMAEMLPVSRSNARWGCCANVSCPWCAGNFPAIRQTKNASF